MKSFPFCQFKNCNYEAKYYILGVQSYLCEAHFVMKYSQGDGVRLTTPAEVKERIEKVEKALKIFLVTSQTKQDRAVKERILKFCDELTCQLIVIKAKLVEVDFKELFYEYTALKNQVNSIQTLIDDEIDFIQFTREFFWSLIGEDYQQENNNEAHNEQIDKLQEELKLKEAKIEELEKENSDLLRTIQGLTSHKAKVVQIGEERDREDRIEASDFNDLYKYIVGETISVGPEYKLKLILKDIKHMEFLKCLDSPIPALNQINLESIPKNDECVKHFLRTSFPVRVQKFHFGYRTELSDINDYVEDVGGVNQSVEERFYIWSFEIGAENLAFLLSMYRNIRFFGTPYCKLDLDQVPDLAEALDGTTIEGLDLYNCGHPSLGNWSKKPSRFDNLIKGLGASEDLKQSLKEVNLAGCGMERYAARQILDSYGFQNADIRV
ncbi:unnamed protein product [Moneuplotes crassus]|uniref:Uncharacterized protein n=2 Tax=Euplotes crassus TaxID=5936 RepID=A0AAD1U8K8_EUPCR|nr:unnamed protein product [Moneuplotes crassus]